MYLTQTLTVLGSLNFLGGVSASGHDYLGAASGMVRLGDWHVVVADDENHLGVFPIPHGVGKIYRISDAQLALDAKERKKVKRDFEALLVLPSTPQGSGTERVGPARQVARLLAVPSGSTENRQIGSLMDFDPAQGAVVASPKPVVLSELYAGIAKKFGLKKINIEGACLQHDSLWLFQRGNTKDGSGLIELDYAAFEKDMMQLGRVGDGAIRGYWPVALGNLGGTPLGFSDATSLPDGRILFSASAEDTERPEVDGKIAGSVLGVLDPRAKKLEWISGRVTREKVEGIAIDRVVGSTLSVAMVTDADDPKVASRMSVVELKGEGR